METAVKERLVGGAILVLLVVLVVPALLTGPRELPPPEPDSEGPTRTVEIDLGGPQPAGDTGEKPVADQPVVAAAPSGLPEPVPAATSAAARPAAQDAPAVPSGADTAPAGQPLQTTSPARVEPAASPARPEPAASPSGWAVQLAALSSQDSATKMVADLKSRGYSAFIVEYRASDRVLYRVRVGPEAQRDRAAALASRLQGEGFKATVVPHP